MTSVITHPGRRRVGSGDDEPAPDGPDDRGTALTILHRYTWWTVPGTIALVLLVFVGDWLLDPDVPVWVRGVCAVAQAVTVVASVSLLSRRLTPRPDPEPSPALRPRPTAWLVAGGAGAVVLGAAHLTFREYGLWAVTPGTMVAVTATFLPPRPRRALVMGALAVAPLPGALVNLTAGADRLLYAAAFPLGMVAFILWTTLGPLWVWDVAGRLERARRLAGDLAVAQERLRFAGDLHDIQGHHLQVIALKSELAARLVTTDPERAVAEMTEVRRLSTAALQDTRALVQGYRRTTLAEEITNATRVLAAADIDARMDLDEVDATAAQRLPAASRHLLGLVVREATTNVLRHSRATRAEVGYRLDGGRVHLRFGNDGALTPAPRTVAAAPAGSGLATLATRLAAAGGELTWRYVGDSFEVVASLPLDTGREAQ